jgi:hypothetical protein
MPDSPRLYPGACAQAVSAVFTKHGISGDIRYATDSGDEAVFALTSSCAANIYERVLTETLIEILHRKVWVTRIATSGPAVRACCETDPPKPPESSYIC